MAGKKPVLEIRQPQLESRVPNDIEIAVAKRLASELADAKIIEEPARDRIIKALSQPATKAP